MTVTDGVVLTGLDQPFPAVVDQRLQQPVARAVGPADDRDQRFVDETADQVDDVADRHVVAGAHPLGGGQIEPAGEHRQPPEHPLLVGEQQVVTPVDDTAQRLLARLRRAAARGQQTEPIVDPVDDLLESQ